MLPRNRCEEGYGEQGHSDSLSSGGGGLLAWSAKNSKCVTTEELAGYDNRIGKIEPGLSLLKWMVGVNLALTAAVLGKLLIP